MTQAKRRTQPFWKTPKGCVMVLLAILTVLASLLSTNGGKGFINVLTAVVVGVIVDWAIGTLLVRKLTLSDGGIVTGLIVGMVLDATTSPFLTAVTTILALLSKHFIKTKRKPIFNPAAVGLLLAVIFLHSGQSWWGGLPLISPWFVMILLVFGYLITDKVNKFPQVLSFLFVYFLMLLGMGMLHIGDAVDALRPPFINCILFFAFFMLTDPPTSPGNNKDQIIFGTLSALISSIVYAIFGGLVYLFIGLFLANIWHYWNSNRKKQRE